MRHLTWAFALVPGSGQALVWEPFETICAPIKPVMRQESTTPVAILQKDDNNFQLRRKVSGCMDAGRSIGKSYRDGESDRSKEDRLVIYS